jgi:CspA family cold shock protein
MSNFKNAQQEWITGTVKMLQPAKAFGFIAGVDGAEYFFHRSAAPDFDDLTVGTAVRFIPKAGGKGPRAEQVEML